MFVAGEHCDIETSHWTHDAFGRRPVLDNWWQTETGWAITCTNVGLGNKLNPPHGATGVPVPGWNGEQSMSFVSNQFVYLRFTFVHIQSVALYFNLINKNTCHDLSVIQWRERNGVAPSFLSHSSN